MRDGQRGRWTVNGNNNPRKSLDLGSFITMSLEMTSFIHRHTHSFSHTHSKGNDTHRSTTHIYSPQQSSKDLLNLQPYPRPPHRLCVCFVCVCVLCTFVCVLCISVCVFCVRVCVFCCRLMYMSLYIIHELHLIQYVYWPVPTSLQSLVPF